MPMTLDQIEEEAKQLPPKLVSELVDRLTLNLHHGLDPKIEEAWKTEAHRRLSEFENGQVQGIPGEKVSERIRRIVRR